MLSCAPRPPARLADAVSPARSRRASPRARPPPAPKRTAASALAAPAAPAAGPTRAAEARLWARGFAAVAGVDEAGRGPLAGPVVAAACVLPRGLQLEGLDDSKKLSEARRDALYEQITGDPGVAWAV